MSRLTRASVLYDGCYAHIYSKALEQRFIYRDEEDFSFFKRLLAQSKLSGCYRLHHYCLMNTHFHLIVAIEKLKLFSKSLQQLKQIYTARFQDKYGHKGPLWWGRFGGQLIENEQYLYACGLYVEMNPVKAGMIATAEDWPHSSARHYLLDQRDGLVDPYEQPAYQPARELTKGLNIGSGSHIGTPLFVVNNK
jgi:putative transposase